MSISETDSGEKFMAKNYYLDPGEVNVHQFYPVLEFTFSKQMTKMDTDLFHTAADGDSELEHTFVDSTQTLTPAGTGEDNDANKEDTKYETDKISDINENECSAEESSTEPWDVTEDKIIQTDVFSTAVSEDSIKAAKLRSQNKDWRQGGNRKVGRLMKIVSKKATEYFQDAMNMKENENPMGGITCLTKAINLKSDEPIFYVERGEAYLILCDFQSAILNYKKACLLAVDSPIFHNRLAFIYYFQGQTLFDQRLFSEALGSFTKASEMVPENVGYQMRCVTSLAALQRYEECLALINKRLAENHSSPDLFIMKARLNEMLANTSLCYRDVREALVLDPNHSEGKAMMEVILKRANSYKLQAMQLSIMGKDKEALQKMSLAVQTNPSVADYHILRGTLHRKLGDYNAAVDEFLLALDMSGHKVQDPTYQNSQRQLLLTFNDFAVECFNKGSYQEAIALLSKALKGEKNEKSLYVNRGDCFFKQDELNFALEDYQQALELDLHDPAIKFRISLVYNEFGVSSFQDKKYADADTKFTLALQYCPLVGQYLVSRARTRYILQNHVGAREDCLQGLLLSPTDEGIMSILSRLCPGRSVTDIINSPAGMDTLIKLNSVLSEHAPDQLNPPSLSDSTVPGGHIDAHVSDSECREDPTRSHSEKIWEPQGCSVGFAMCMEDPQFYVKQVQEKRKVNLRVKEALCNRRSLRDDSPQIQSLPPTFKKHNGKSKG